MRDLRSVCVYCGSSGRVSDRFKDAARALGGELAANGIALVYGGGRVGLMGLTADASLDGGGQVVGIIPSHIRDMEVDHPGLTELHVVDSMHTRKMMMFDRSDAFVILPGGLGTLDEMFEIITWRQLGIHDKPVVLVNIDGYWDRLLAMIDGMIEAGFAQPAHKDLFKVVAGIDDVVDALRHEPTPVIEPQTKWL
ncbi:TIGR00730 family Rossman fold protein [Fodinicurvata sp. EGI_FJ10296]|uniref:LOG family protein n=1 Tax=Fodinicurvata sp. EGI_FJ10296 TaxID=3231908 RepID=UPI003456FA6F